MKINREKKHSEMNLTVNDYVEMIENKEIIFDIDIQRPYVWKDVEQKSALIQSLIINDIIPPFIFNKIEDKYEAIDSKQRSLTIYKFLKDEFALKGVIPIEVINDAGELEELNINDLKFSELSKFVQTTINNYNLSIWCLDEASQEQIARNFCNLNNGKIINSATLNRVKAKSKEQIKRLGEHKLFQEALSEVALNGHVNEDLAVKAHAMLNADEPSMDTKWIRPYMRNVDITKQDEEELMEIFDRICNIHSMIGDKKVANRIYTKTHMISIVPIIVRSLNDGLSDKQMMEWFVNFFNGKRTATISSVYNSAAGSGSGKKEAVRKRVEEIEKNYNEFFKSFLAS